MTANSLTRRHFLAATAAAGVVTGFPAIVRAQSKTIVTTLFGGAYEENYRKHVLDPFSARTGAEFVIKYGSADEWLNNALVNRDAPEIDLPFLSLPVAMRAIRVPDLFLELTANEIPALADVHPIFKDTYEGKAVGFNYVDYGILYREDMVEKPITAWADLWDPSLAGKILAPAAAAGSMYELVMIAATLAGDGSDWNLGIEKLKELKPNVARWFNTANEVDGLIQRQEAGVAAGFGGFRSYALIDGGVPGKFVTPTEGAPMGVLSYHVPTNAANRDLLLEFVDFALSVDRQVAFGNAMPTGVVNSKAVLDPAVASRIAPADQLLRIDWASIQSSFTEITQRMQQEVISG
ncbi:Tat (twin-arginine translocation) pathway signal sequence [Devosia sp. YR412]|uniref:extracellular solute-binding protein n=1 Tax=Devosia sp. YR412 TaxID=1881030 RepID=UPI0008CDC7AF|nr:extracellular solute-binding protein [Devosia sp. YR412]SEQ48977.1 Tat (twin-arginine translocation) pathway signal sequence [Devosia sp. YR412]